MSATPGRFWNQRVFARRCNSVIGSALVVYSGHARLHSSARLVSQFGHLAALVLGTPKPSHAALRLVLCGEQEIWGEDMGYTYRVAIWLAIGVLVSFSFGVHGASDVIHEVES